MIFTAWNFRKNNSELIELSSVNKVSFVLDFSCSNTRGTRGDPYCTV